MWAVLVLIDCGYLGTSRSISIFYFPLGGAGGCNVENVKDFNNVLNVLMTALDGGGPECFRDGDPDYDQPVKKQNPDSGYKHLWTESLPDNYQAGTINQVKV